jgi:hypothetical protein
VLSLKCPIQNAAHIMVWHLGAIAVSAVGGFAVGMVFDRARSGLTVIRDRPANI